MAREKGDWIDSVEPIAFPLDYARRALRFFSALPVKEESFFFCLVPLPYWHAVWLNGMSFSSSWTRKHFDTASSPNPTYSYLSSFDSKWINDSLLQNPFILSLIVYLNYLAWMECYPVCNRICFSRFISWFCLSTSSFHWLICGNPIRQPATRRTSCFSSWR